METGNNGNDGIDLQQNKIVATATFRNIPADAADEGGHFLLQLNHNFRNRRHTLACAAFTCRN